MFLPLLLLLLLFILSYYDKLELNFLLIITHFIITFIFIFSIICILFCCYTFSAHFLLLSSYECFGIKNTMILYFTLFRLYD